PPAGRRGGRTAPPPRPQALPVPTLRGCPRPHRSRKGSTLDWHPFDLPLTDPRHPFHLHHMEMALEEADAAAAADEVPVGAVIVSLERGVIARAHNQREQLHDPTAH